jgi:protein SCO1/2
MNSIFTTSVLVFGALVFMQGCASAEKPTTTPASAETKAALPADSIFNLPGSWFNEREESVALMAMRGQPSMIAMVYTQCAAACPMMVQNIKQILETLPASQRAKVRVSLFSFDHIGENAATLKKFREKYKLTGAWTPYRASAGTVAELAGILGVQYKRLESGDYAHSNQITLLDGEGRITAVLDDFAAERSDFLKKLNQVTASN